MQDVNVANFARAESDVAIEKTYSTAGGFGRWSHYRAPTPIDNQPVIRMNSDTLYSSAVLDLSEPATVVMPDTDGRYQSLQVINQDHYSFAKVEPGRHELTEELVGTRYAYLIVRTFMDADDPADVEACNPAQDALVIEGGGAGPLEIPDWNLDQLAIARDALNTLAKLGVSNVGAFGSREQTDPTNHLPIADGWNYAIRMYEPEPEILDGTWTFPTIEPADEM